MLQHLHVLQKELIPEVKGNSLATVTGKISLWIIFFFALPSLKSL
jgi:hypothetical protein